jgi:hypothetical protein
MFFDNPNDTLGADLGVTKTNSKGQTIRCTKQNSKGKCTSWAVVAQAKPSLSKVKTPTVKPPQFISSGSANKGTGAGAIYNTSTGVYVPPPPPLVFNNVRQPTAAAINSGGKFNSITALISQGLSAFGKNPNTQVGNGVSAIYAQNPAAIALRQQQLVAQQSENNGGGYNADGTAADRAAGGAASFVNSIVNFVSNNPLMMGGILLGTYLLLKEPPIQRR